MIARQSNYQYAMLYSELADAVGKDHVSANASDQLGHSVDYYWIPEMWLPKLPYTH